MNFYHLTPFIEVDGPTLDRPNFDAYMQQSTRHELKERIVANQANSFSDEQLDQFSTEQLRGIATFAAGGNHSIVNGGNNHFIHDGTNLFGISSGDATDDEPTLPRPGV